MSCAALDDLEDLAGDIYQQEESRVKPQKERQLKKHKKAAMESKQRAEEAQKENVFHTDNSAETEPFSRNHPARNQSTSKLSAARTIFQTVNLWSGNYRTMAIKLLSLCSKLTYSFVNSCTVVNPSQDAFISMVAQAKKLRKPLVVAGCVPQGDKHIPELEDVSALGVTQIDRVVYVVNETLKGNKVHLMTKKELPSLDLPKIRKNKAVEIIPINAGCLGSCTYCKTVFVRGRLISYKPNAIIHRIRTVALEGVQEIWLTSEDTGAYGRDIGSNIAELLLAICYELEHHPKLMRFSGSLWCIALLSPHVLLSYIGMTNPPYMLEHLKTISLFLSHPRVFSFIHVPVQAGSNAVLERMNRYYKVYEFRTVCNHFLDNVPAVTIATDIICGFPEETEANFEESLSLIDHYKFSVVYINQFYLRPGTPAAHFKQLPSQIVKNRSSRLTELFKSYKHHDEKVGLVERVWINESEQHKGQLVLVGHTKNYTKVVLPYNYSIFYQQVLVRITSAKQWHIEGEIIERCIESIPIPSDYLSLMKASVYEEKLFVYQRKKQKLLKIKEKLRQQRYSDEVNPLVDKSTIISPNTNSCCSSGDCETGDSSCAKSVNSCCSQASNLCCEQYKCSNQCSEGCENKKTETIEYSHANFSVKPTLKYSEPSSSPITPLYENRNANSLSSERANQTSISETMSKPTEQSTMHIFLLAWILLVLSVLAFSMGY